MELSEVNTGINQFRHYVFRGTFGLMDAKLAASKAACLAAIILTDYKGEIQRFNPEISLTDYLKTNPDFNSLNKRLKFVAGGEPYATGIKHYRLDTQVNKSEKNQ